MPLGLLIIGAVLAVSALRGTERDLGTLVAGDFTGAGNFGYWIAALAIVGGLGYIPGIQGPARALLALIVIVFVLANGTGFFSQLQSAIAAGPQSSSTSGVKVETPVQAPPHVVLEGGGAGGAAGLASGVVGAGLKAFGAAVGGLVQ